eukprot:TRINITY_DN4928_c0_g1_i1.p1 TRINITY_DN4928_c0_g1~~TRINITY_DN4928_c0_g1_i1.p1  ORF type:complete len:482 (+),score=88.80 TRINITY_DN4928_c0_g1_i1:197-1447(+)
MALQQAMTTPAAGLAATGERIDKAWVVAMMDQHLATINASLDEVQKRIDARLDAVESVATAMKHTNHRIQQLERKTEAHNHEISHLYHEAGERAARNNRRRSEFIASQADARRVAENLLVDVREAINFMREETMDKLSHVWRLEEAQTFYIAKMKKAYDAKLLKQGVASAMFTLEALVMEEEQRDRAMMKLTKEQKRLDGAEAMDGDQVVLPLELADAFQLLPRILTQDIQEVNNVREVENVENRGQEGSTKSAPLQDELTPQQTEIISSEPTVAPVSRLELEALSVKMSMLTLSSNLFCLQCADLSSTSREKCAAAIETQLQMLRAQHNLPGRNMQDLIASFAGQYGGSARSPISELEAKIAKFQTELTEDAADATQAYADSGPIDDAYVGKSALCARKPDDIEVYFSDAETISL